jgi:hypothetical protein
MSAKLYKVIFKGEIYSGFPPEEVKSNLMQIFKLDPNQADALLSHAQITIKQGIDHATALKYRMAMYQAGAICYIEDADAMEKPVSKMPVSENKDFVEKRRGTRRGIMDRRKRARLSSIQPDRRQNKGRRNADS